MLRQNIVPQRPRGQTLVGVFSSLVLLSSCATSKSTPESASANPKQAAHYLKSIDTQERLGDLKAPKLWHMYFSGQPTPSDLKAAKAKGVTWVLSLRSKKENPYKEKDFAESIGLKYQQIPLFNALGEIDPQAVPALKAFHERTQGQLQLIHCSTGNRAAAWFALHLIQDRGVPREEAFLVGKALGMQPEKIQSKLETYLKSL